MAYRVIAIAGLPGSGKSTLLRAIKKTAYCTHWHEISTGGLLRQRHAELLAKGEFQGTFIEYLNSLSNDEICILNKRAKEEITHGHCLLDSRYAVENSRGLSDCLRVFLTAPLSVRVARLTQSHPEKTEEEIKKDLTTREHWEYEKGQELYAYDYRDHVPYALIIDTAKATIEEEVALILAKVQSEIT